MSAFFPIATLLPAMIGMLSFFMLLLALSISLSRTVLQMIRLYRIQSCLLAMVTLLNAINPIYEGRHLPVAAFVLIPIFLAVIIEPLLAQATVPENVSFLERMKRLTDRNTRSVMRIRSLPIWLERREAHRYDALWFAFNLIWIVASYMTAFNLWKSSSVAEANSLAISFALLLLGLSTMSSKQDLISQIMGLLVMEHGLFLAAVQVFALYPITIMLVVASLFLYIIITLTILVLLLPELHASSGSIEVEGQQQLKG